MRNIRDAGEWRNLPSHDSNTPCADKQSQDAAQRFSVGAYQHGELGGCARGLIQLVGDAEICDDVQASRQTVSTRHLSQRLEWIGFRHWNVSCPGAEVRRPSGVIGLLDGVFVPSSGGRVLRVFLRFA